MARTLSRVGCGTAAAFLSILCALALTLPGSPWALLRAAQDAPTPELGAQIALLLARAEPGDGHARDAADALTARVAPDRRGITLEVLSLPP